MIPDNTGFAALTLLNPRGLFGFAVKLLNLPAETANFLYGLSIRLSFVVRDDTSAGSVHRIIRAPGG